MRSLSLVVAALLLVSCAKDADLTVVAASVDLFDQPGGTSRVVTSGLGARFKGRRGKKGWWKLKLADGKQAFAPPEALAPFPITGQKRWVVTPFAGQLAKPDLTSRTLTAKYEIGTELEIVGGAPWLPPEIAAVVSSGTVLGFVAVRTVGDRAPMAADLLAAAREALLAGKTDEALMQGTRALLLDPRHAGARAMVAALHEAKGDPEAASMQDALVVPETPPPAVTAKAGDAVFVGVASLELRKAKGATTEVLARLPINTPLTVRAVDGTWAQVAWKGQPDVGRHIDLDPFWSVAATPTPTGTPVAVATSAARTAIATSTPVLEEVAVDDETSTGWVLGGHLAASEQNADAAAGVARQRLAEGKAAEAVELFERAATLAPSNLDVTRELLVAAVKADRYLVAAYAALALGRGGDDLGGLEVVTMDLFYGCRGERYEAEPVSGVSAPEADDSLLDNACVYDVDAEPLCEPCTYDEHDHGEYGDYGGGDYEGDDDGEPEETPEISEEEAERRRQIEEAEAAAAAAQEAVAQAERDAEVEKAGKEFEVEVAGHILYLTKIDTAYAGDSWVYLEIKNRQAGRVAGAKLQLYRVNVGAGDGSTWYDTTTLETAEVELPPLGPNASVGLWFTAASYAGVEYGVTRLPSEEIAREKLTKALNERSSGDAMPPHQSVLHEKNDCNCGGC